MKYALLFILTTLSYSSIAQNTPWTVFWNADTTLKGYTNTKGEVMIPTKVSPVSMARQMDHLMAIIEFDNQTAHSYYINQSKKTFGRDSLYFFDNGTDCEQEGFIRFKDHATDMVGMFNKNGQVVIPATYNMLSKVSNGWVIALQGATKVPLHPYDNDGHFRWKGGNTYLIDTGNQVLIKDFPLDHAINLYAAKKTETPVSNPVRRDFTGTDGQHYSFIDYKKEFHVWLKDSLLQYDTTKLTNGLSDSIYYWQQQWNKVAKADFLEQNKSLLLNKLKQIHDEDTEYHIFIESLNPFIFNSAHFKKYYNNCGESDQRFPVLSLVIDYASPEFKQDSFDFLRTEDGYRLISLSIQKGEIDE